MGKATRKDQVLASLITVALSLPCCAGVVFGGPWLINRYLGLDPLTEEEVRNGRACTATVLSIKDMNSTINRAEVFGFRLQVTPEDGIVYEATVSEPLNALQAAQVKADGTRYRCIIDRDDSSRVKVFWSEATSTPHG
ncbi:hypothetical protein AB0C02_24150 [Micromonospora sp. NPDC048999]|uniref:hypothetical protein n=1 Tax=Micromonospora sp. NPDC048999 TaxID=3155391 RepID=UPI0033FF5537